MCSEPHRARKVTYAPPVPPPAPARADLLNETNVKLHAVYTGDVNEAVEGFLKFQPLELGGAGSDEEGPNEVDEATMWGADPVAAFEASRRHEVKPEVPQEDSVTMKAHRKMVKDFGTGVFSPVEKSAV